jgi:Spy/CpxP family protein refolding chaperone
MNAMRKQIGMLAVIAMMALTATAQETKTQGGEKRSKEMRHDGDKADRFADLPNITEEQKTRLRAIYQDTKKTTEPQRAEMKVLREKLQAVRLSDNPDQKEMNLLIDKMHALKGEMEKTRVAAEMKAMTILTAEQQAAFKLKMKERGEKREGKHKMEQKESISE